MTPGPQSTGKIGTLSGDKGPHAMSPMKFNKQALNYIQGQENMYGDLRTLANNLSNEDLGVHVRRSFITAIFLLTFSFFLFNLFYL